MSLIFPCYNEEERMPASLARVREYLDGRGWDHEILVVDDGSADDTAAAARAASADPRLRVLSYEPNQGKGFAVAYGVEQARGRWVLFSDADLSTPIEELEKLVPHLREGWDIVIGSRGLKESYLKVRQPWWRERCGKLMNFLIRCLSGLPYRDTQCGFKLFSGPAARDIFPRLTVRRWMFDVEVLVLARKLGYRVLEVPVTWINSEGSRVRLSHAPNILWELLHLRWHWLARKLERLPEQMGASASQPTGNQVAQTAEDTEAPVRPAP